MQLYRPVGLIELQRIYESRMQSFPPRLPEQPIFYPVLNFGYADQIARTWNTKSHSFAGYVTEFVVDDPYVAQFERRVVGSRQHEELWVPAEQLAEFNQHIIGLISVSAAYFGPQFRGYVPDRFGMKGRNAVEQFVLLVGIFDYNLVDFRLEISANNLAVFLHYPFWTQYDFSAMGIAAEQQMQVLTAIESIWHQVFADIPLPNAQARARPNKPL
jgi:hypothetical protein